MLSDIDTTQEVDVIDLSSFKFDTNKPIKEQIQEKLNKLTEPISTKTKKILVDIVTSRRKNHIEGSSQYVRLQKDRKARQRHNKEVLNIDTLIQNSILVEIAPNTKTNQKGKKDIENYYYFYIPVRFSNSIYTVQLSAEQKIGEKEINSNTVHLYDVIEIKKSGRAAARNSSSQMQIPDTISIAEMLTGVNDYLGNPYLFEEQKEQVKQQAIANGTFLKTPNGNKSNLNENLQLTVRTKAFKNWFGDWENSPQTASKVVDENGEPLVVYHWTSKVFSIFDKTKSYQGLFWFSSDYNKVKNGYDGATGKGIVMPTFVNIKNPANWDLYDKYSPKELENLKYDGLLLKDNDEIVVVAFNNNQVKSINNKGTFNKNNPDIYYQANNNRGEVLPKPINTPINEQSKSIINILESGG